MTALSFRDAFAKASLSRFRRGEPLTFAPVTGGEESCFGIWEREADRQGASEGEQARTVLTTEVQVHAPEKAKDFLTGISISKVPIRGDKFKYRKDGIATDFIVQEVVHNDYIEVRFTAQEVRNAV